MTDPGVRQAVIMAGGRGTRLRPLTDDRPKPMIAFHGKPFLEYLIEQLADQGIRDIVLLLGYLPDVIERHFADGTRWGVRIRYSITEPTNLTARRLLDAEPLLNDAFLLMYCDNYWPIDLPRHLDRYETSDCSAMVTVYANHDRYSRDNVQLDARENVARLDPTRESPGLQGVEIGYAILRREHLRQLPPAGDAQVEHALYPSLAADGDLAAFVTRHRYYSVGALERLSETERFLSRQPSVVLDRDGVLNVRPARAEYVRHPSEFHWLDGALAALQLFHQAGYRVVIVSNQAGIARGALAADDLERVHGAMVAAASSAGGAIDAIYYCPHGWDDACECRKPRPGMLFQAQRELALDLSRTPFIGDDERDGTAADAAGMPFYLVDAEHDLLSYAEQLTTNIQSQAAS